MELELSGKRALVTGGSRGIGRAIALEFARHGMQVAAAHVRDSEASESLAKELDAFGTGSHTVKADLSGDERSAQGLVEAVVEKFGGIDVLVNNAAIFSTIVLKPFWEIGLEEWDAMMAVNVRGSWLAMKAVVPAMRERGGGSIINVSSSVVPGGRPNYLHYVTSKAAVIGMTRSAARELGDFNIRVNCLMPGTVTTEIPRQTVTPERAKALLQNQSLKRAGTVDDLVGIASFLASDDSRYMTGQTLNVDGGNVFL